MSVRPPYLWSYYRFARKIMEHANDFKRIIAPSQYAKDRFVRAGFASEQIEVLPYFCPVAPISESKDFDAKQITLLFIGRIRPYKGVDYFIDALAQLPEYVRGVIIGDIETSYAKELAESESARSCGGRLRFRKWMERNELATVMREATALIFPSIWPETMGIVGPEAMAHGVPVVSCKVGGIEEWLQDGINGYLAPPKDATAIALAVKRLVSSPENYRCFSESGKQLMREKFSVNRHVDRLVRIYKEAIEP